MVKICIIPFLIGILGAVINYVADYYNANQSTITEELQKNVREK